ncbi:hypothetical protein [Sciscionella sediminilitoris]|nr:hypothetical protein [Sciscionella sp. SE31]
MNELIAKIAEDHTWSKWVAENSAQGEAKDGCISLPKQGCIS